MLQYDFMRHAFLAGTLVALMCGIIGVFIIARNLSFIAHTFSHIGFSGASFAVWLGWDPLSGLLLFTTLSGLAVGRMGVGAFKRDASISVVLSFFLGLGFLFLSLTAKSASFATTILFGSVVGISSAEVAEITVLSLLVLLLLGLGYRRLVFDSFDPVGAQAAGLPSKWISMGFLLLLAIAVAQAVQIIGALMVFALMTIPAASARYLVRSIFGMMAVSSLFALLGVWLGLTLSYYSNAPASFLITTLESAVYFGSLSWQSLRQRGRSRPVSTV